MPKEVLLVSVGDENEANIIQNLLETHKIIQLPRIQFLTKPSMKKPDNLNHLFALKRKRTWPGGYCFLS